MAAARKARRGKSPELATYLCSEYVRPARCGSGRPNSRRACSRVRDLAAGTLAQRGLALVLGKAGIGSSGLSIKRAGALPFALILAGCRLDLLEQLAATMDPA